MAVQEPSNRARAFWSTTVWLARGWLLGIAITAWRYHNGAGLHEALSWTAMFVGGLIAHQIAHRQALGWWIDDRGERQKVLAFSRGYVIHGQRTTYLQRIAEEQATRTARRWRIFWFGLVSLPPGYFAWQQMCAADWALAVPVGLLSLYALVPLAWNLEAELLYLAGWQDMEGAKVLDPPPGRPGLDAVYAQQVFGAVPLPGEAESISILNPNQ